MANNSNMIPIPGRLHSVATDGQVAGANEIHDDAQNKNQSTINSELINAVGSGGSVDSRIAAAVNEEKTRAEGAENALDGRVDTLEEAVGTGGSVDTRISSAVSAEATRAQAAEADRYTKSETYTKEEVNNLITTPSQEYVSVTATDQTTSVTDVLPATGAADTTYRVGNWDGTQYNDSVFSEYAWNGSAYIKLSTKSQIGEVYDISANHADTKYADLSAALGVDGANIPSSLRRGGMSVKFVQNSDNRYVQYRLVNNTWSTELYNWIDEQKYLSYGFDDEFKFNGKGNTGDFARFTLVSGKKYRVKLSNTNWSDTGVSVAKFSIQHSLNGTAVADIVVYPGDTPQSFYDFTAVDADYYTIGFRGASGATLSVSVIPLIDSSDIVYNNTTVEENLDELNSYYVQSVNINTLPNRITQAFRLKYAAYLPKRKCKIHITAENIPNGYSFSLGIYTTQEAALGITVSPTEGYGWNENDVLFTDSSALWLGINFKKDEGDLTQQDITLLNGSSIIIDVLDAYVVEGKTDIVSLNDKEQTLRYLRNLKRPNISQDGQYRDGKTPFTLLHFSDLHADAVNLGRIMEYKQQYADYIDDTICSGDIIRNIFDDSYTFWNNANAQSILVSTGNHEYYNGETSEYYQSVTPKQVYDKFFAPYIANWGNVVFPQNAAANGYNYYYKDYTSQSVRLIVLDNMANMKGERNNVQATWLASVLEDARQNELHVICAIHIGSTIITPFNTPFTSMAAFINSDNGANSQAYAEFYTLRDAVETFIGNGGKFIAWITGHTHNDSIGILTNYSQCIIHVPTAAGGDTQYDVDGHVWWLIPRGDDCSRADNTKSQDCLNLYSVDTEKGMLRLFRVGNDLDRYGRHKGVLVYDYFNKNVVYSD